MGEAAGQVSAISNEIQDTSDDADFEFETVTVVEEAPFELDMSICITGCR
jgi:hypothetical protein